MEKLFTPRISPSLRAVLNNEFWFGDKGPIWHRMQTEEQAILEQRDRVRILKRRSKTMPPCEWLAEQLAGCEEDCRCGSGACALCSRAMQRSVVNSLEYLFEDAPGSNPVMCTVASFRGRIYPGEMSAQRMINIRNYFLRGYADAGLTWLAGGLDIQPYGGKKNCYFDIHTHVFTKVTDVQKAEADLTSWTRREGSEKGWKPAELSDWDGGPEGNSYPFKYRFPNLAASDEVKARLMIAYHLLGLDRRLLLKGVKRHAGDRNVRLRIIMPE